MSSATTELSSAKKNLTDVLGDNMKLYLQILKSWFRQKVTRDDFDREARKLLSADSVHLHNQFLLAILTKCQTIGSALVQRDPNTVTHTATSTPHKVKKVHDKLKRRSNSARVTFHQRFVEASILTQAALVQPHIPEPEEHGPGFLSRELLLPDVGLVHGRTIVSAWDYGLDDVDDDAVRLLLQAVQVVLRNLVTTLVCRRRSYRLREGRFRHGFGTERPPTFLQNSALVRDHSYDSEATSVSQRGVHMPTLRPSVETGYGDAAVQTAAGTTTPATRGYVTLFDLYDALQVHKSALPCHSVYAIAMERISNRLHHHSNEELTQEAIHQQEAQIKRELQAQQAVIRT